MAAPAWTTACPDWEEKLVNNQSIIPNPIFPEEADRALAIFKRLRVSDLAGKPTFGECCKPWVFDLVRAIFGGYDSETGRQLIREYGLLVSKKNTKSTIASGIMLTALITCWREDEEHLILAPTKEVADNSFRPAAGMIRCDEELSDLFQVQDHIRTITHRLTKSTLKVVAADTDTVSGKKAGKILVDELWLFGKKANAEAMFMEALGGQVSRPEGWVIFLTTQSDEPPAGAFKTRLNYWRDVRDGIIVNNKVLGILYEFPAKMIKDKSYLKEEYYHITNPNLGASVDLETITDLISRNKDAQDGSYQKILSKHLNIEIGLNLRSDRWVGTDYWMAASDPSIGLNSIIERCEVVVIGIDGGGLDDLLGLTVLGREKGGKKWLSWSKAWAHPSVLDRNKKEVSKLHDFSKQGDVSLVQHIGEDTAEIAAIVLEVYKAKLLDKIAIDPHGVGSILSEIAQEGVPDELVIGISQGWKMMGSIKTTERKLADGTLLHANQPLMDWCVSNARVIPKDNAIQITKSESGKAKIDPLMALFNAVAVMSQNPESKKKSYKVHFI